MWLKIPAGKSVKCVTGGYVFHGPRFISVAQRFVFPKTYTDGTPVEYVTKQPNSDDGSPAPSIGSAEVGSEGSRGYSAELPGSDFVRPNSGESGELEVFQEQLSGHGRKRRRSGETSENNDTSQEGSEQDSLGGFYSDSLGDGA